MTDSQNPFEEMMRQMPNMANDVPAREAISPKGSAAVMGTVPNANRETYFRNKCYHKGVGGPTR